MKTSLSALVMFLLHFSLFCQEVENGNVPVSATAGGGYESLYANLMNKKKIDIHNRLGTPYLFETWEQGKVMVMGEESTFEEIKVDVLNNCLEIRLNGASKVLDPEYITSFDLFPNNLDTLHFVNGIQYHYENRKLSGFVKVRKTGDMAVLTRYKAKIDKPGENSKIVGQDTREKIIQTKEIYVMKNNVLYHIKNRKDLLEVLSRKEKKINLFMKENKINVKNEEDIATVLDFFQQH